VTEGGIYPFVEGGGENRLEVHGSPVEKRRREKKGKAVFLCYMGLSGGRESPELGIEKKGVYFEK